MVQSCRVEIDCHVPVVFFWSPKSRVLYALVRCALLSAAPSVSLTEGPGLGRRLSGSKSFVQKQVGQKKGSRQFFNF